MCRFVLFILQDVRGDCNKKANCNIYSFTFAPKLAYGTLIHPFCGST